MGQNLSVSRVVTAKAGRRFFSKKPKDGDEENKRLSLENVADELTDSSLVSSASTVEVSAVEDSTVKDSPTFHPFPRLAAELRLKIWELAAVHRHQVVELIPVETCMKDKIERVEIAVDGGKVAVKVFGIRLWNRNLPPRTQVYVRHHLGPIEVFKHWQTHSTTPVEISNLAMTCTESAAVIERMCPAVRNLHLIRQRAFQDRDFEHTFKNERGMCCRQRYNPANITIFLRAWNPNPVADIPLHLPYEAKQATSLVLEYAPSKNDVVPYLAKALRCFRKMKYLIILARLDERIGKVYHPGMYGWSAEDVNIYRPLELTKWLSEIDPDMIDLMKEVVPGWNMPLVKCIVTAGENLGRLGYEDIFLNPDSRFWVPFQRLGEDGSWSEVYDHRGPEEYN